MKPIEFSESNKTLLPPTDMKEPCSNLPIYTDGKICISCWKPSFKEWIKLIFKRNVWIYVRSGQTQPPIAVTSHRPWK